METSKNNGTANDNAFILQLYFHNAILILQTHFRSRKQREKKHESNNFFLRTALNYLKIFTTCQSFI